MHNTSECGQGMDRTMTITPRAGSVTAHVLRNDVLHRHIDVKIKWSVHHACSLDRAAMIPRRDGVHVSE
jgi:hypothetical protein